MLSRKRASTLLLFTPGTCTVISCLAAKKCMHRSRCITMLSLLDLALMTSTTAMLSECIWTCKDDSCSPHAARERMTGTISFVAMFTDCQDDDHGALNQHESQYAPHPHPPEASVKMWASGALVTWLFSSDIPFHLSRNRSHHLRSAFGLLVQSYPVIDVRPCA